MNFSRTFYSKKPSKNKLYLSKNLFWNTIKDNNSIFYNTNYKKYNSFSKSLNKSSKNFISKNELRTISKLLSEKHEKKEELKEQLKTFYKNEIQAKIRKSTKYKSLFEKTEISDPNKFHSDLERVLINSKLKSKSNKKKFNFIITNTNNSNNFDLNSSNINSVDFIKKSDNISKNKFLNSRSMNLFKGEKILKTHYTKYFPIESKKEINKEDIRKNIYKNILEKITYIRSPPYFIDFREKNLINFYEQTKNFCFQKYHLFLQRNKLEVEKMRNDLILTLGDMNIIKYMKIQNLFKPYNINFERYLSFLKEKIFKEIKQKDKLKLIEGELIEEIVILKKRLMNMHKTLKLYIDDKYFLLCVKNSTLDMEKFSDKYKTEYKIDLQNLETLKRYINEISELANEEDMLTKNKKNLDTKVKENKPNSEDEIPFNSKIEKIRGDFEKNFKHSLNFKDIFESEEEFLHKINAPQKRIENLLKMDDETECETANMREFISQHSKEIQKAKEISLYQENMNNKYKKSLLEEKRKNKYLLDYKNKIIKLKRYNVSYKIIKRIKNIRNNILYSNDKVLNSFFPYKSRKLKDNPTVMLKSLEDTIIFLINFKQQQKQINYSEYSKVIKVIEKNNRLAIIKQKKEEIKLKAENKLKEIIEKNMKVFLKKDKRVNVKYKPLKNFDSLINKDKNEDDEKSIDILY